MRGCVAFDINPNIRANLSATFSRISLGNELTVDKSKTEIYDGKIYCIRYDCQLYVKRLQKLPRKTIKVISDNKEQFDAFYIDFSKETDIDFQVIGEVR